MNKKMRIGFFGCGNMGSALAKGIHKHFHEIELYLYTPSKNKAIQLAKDVQGHFVESIEVMPKDLDWYFLAFKPQSLNDFNFTFKSSNRIISVLAGVSIESLTKKFAVNAVARLMPNTPSSVGMGANLFFADLNYFKNDDLIEIKNILNSCGKLFVLESEADLNTSTPFSGSGPGLIFEIARIFEEELNKRTGHRLPAKEIIAQTFLGSSILMNSNLSLEDLRNQVTSKNGVTYEALEVFKNLHLQDLISNAIDKAIQRNTELSK